MIQNIEKQSLKFIKAFQEKKLSEVLNYVNENSTYYKRLFRENNIDPSEIKTLEDLVKIPTTSKDDLQSYNDDFLCVSKTEIIDYVTTSGTLGEPITIALTEKDLERLAYNEAISFENTGITKADVIQLMTTIDRRFMAGLAYVLGSRKIGAGIIRVGAGIPELQWDSIKKFRPTYLIAVPSFLLKLKDFALQHKIDINSYDIKGAICIGESIRNDDFSLNTLGQKIKDDWDIDLFSTYASTEMQTAFTECEHQCGGHQHPELIIIEILDDNDKPVEEGMHGELTITTLGVEGMPLIRFKTGDILKVYKDPCKCGRNSARLGPVIGRKKQMVKYKGTTLFPPAMQNVMNHFKEIDSFIIEISHNEVGTDKILLKISSQRPSEDLLQQIKDHFRAKLRVTPKVKFYNKEEIDALRFPKLSRKPVVVIDKRD